MTCEYYTSWKERDNRKRVRFIQRTTWKFKTNHWTRSLLLFLQSQQWSIQIHMTRALRLLHQQLSLKVLFRIVKKIQQYVPSDDNKINPSSSFPFLWTRINECWYKYSNITLMEGTVHKIWNNDTIHVECLNFSYCC